MIEGEAGPAILSQVVALQMDAITDGDQISCTLAAACIADALRKRETPREIAQNLLNSLPSDAAWDSHIRARVEAAVEELES